MAKEFLHLRNFLHVEIDVVEVFEEVYVLELAEVCFDETPICLVNLERICDSVFNNLWKLAEDSSLQGVVFLMLEFFD